MGFLCTAATNAKLATAMKHIIGKLNKVFESRIRLGIMSVLMVNDWIDFSELKDLLGVTDGNLASHLQALEKNGYVVYSKGFVGRKPNTRYQATDVGKQAFSEHIDNLERLLHANE